jgi:hypothetical protein
MNTSFQLPDAVEISRRLPAIARHAERLVLPLSEMCERYLGEVANPRQRATLAEVFARLNIPELQERYSLIQADHLSEANIAAYEELAKAGTHISPEFKYLDFPFWVAGKWRTASAMNLKALENQGKVFDIGSGPGHLATVCSLLGIGYFGVDAPLTIYKNATRQHIYDDLRDIFPYDRQTYNITPQSDMKGFGTYDLVVCQMGIFCSHILSTGARIGWSLEDWEGFLPRLMDNVVKPGGEVYLQLSRQFVHGEVADYLAARSWQAHLDTNVFRLRR